MREDDQELSEQLKTLISFKTKESSYKFLRDLWYLFLILFFMALGFGLFAAGQYWACVSRWPDKTFAECMRYDIEPKRFKK